VSVSPDMEVADPNRHQMWPPPPEVQANINMIWNHGQYEMKFIRFLSLVFPELSASYRIALNRLSTKGGEQELQEALASRPSLLFDRLLPYVQSSRNQLQLV
jgi:hypothetical protein